MEKYNGHQAVSLILAIPAGIAANCIIAEWAGTCQPWWSLEPGYYVTIGCAVGSIIHPDLDMAEGKMGFSSRLVGLLIFVLPFIAAAAGWFR